MLTWYGNKIIGLNPFAYCSYTGIALSRSRTAVVMML